MKKLFKMVVNVEKLLKMVKMVIFQNLSKMVKCWKMLVKTFKKNFAVIFFYTMDIKNTIFNPKFYQHFLPSLLITHLLLYKCMYHIQKHVLQCIHIITSTRIWYFVSSVYNTSTVVFNIAAYLSYAYETAYH